MFQTTKLCPQTCLMICTQKTACQAVQYEESSQTCIFYQNVDMVCGKASLRKSKMEDNNNDNNDDNNDDNVCRPPPSTALILDSRSRLPAESIKVILICLLGWQSMGAQCWGHTEQRDCGTATMSSTHGLPLILSHRES